MRTVKVKAALVAAVSLLAGSAANAVTMPVTYVGGGFFTTVTSSCATVGFAANQGFTVVYRPASEGLKDGLLLQFQLGSALLSAAATSLNGKQKFSSTGITDKAVLYGSNGTSNLKIVTAAGGLSVTITGTIADLYGDPSCTLTMRAAATQRP